jgi:hypothetical protein
MIRPIHNGDVLTFTAVGKTSEYWPRTADGVRSDALDSLTPFFEVESLNIKTASALGDPVHFVLGVNWGYTATIRAKVRADYGDVRDVDSIVAHAFYEAGGEVPTVTSNLEQSQDAPKSTEGITLTGAIVLVAVALVAVAVIKVT